MKRIIALLLGFVFLSSLLGCSPETGYMTYTGIYVETSEGQSVLIHSVDGREEYYLLHESENCNPFDNLKTGDKITILCPCLAYEDAILSEKTVYKWDRKVFGHIDVSLDTLNHIDDLLANSNQ